MSGELSVMGAEIFRKFVQGVVKAKSLFGKSNFDFTELKNPFKQDSIMKGFLWAANDIAYMDEKWGLLDPVGVEITYTKKY